MLIVSFMSKNEKRYGMNNFRQDFNVSIVWKLTVDF